MRKFLISRLVTHEKQQTPMTPLSSFFPMSRLCFLFHKISRFCSSCYQARYSDTGHSYQIGQCRHIVT